MNAWDMWTWPWAGAVDMCLRAMEAVGLDEPPLDECKWTTANRVVLDLDTLRLRDFCDSRQSDHPALIVAPFALHDAALADLAPGHSLIEALRANGRGRLFLAEWKSATQETRLNTIDAQLAALLVAVEEIGTPLDLIGLCQGGWLSLVFAARFPHKVRRLVLAGSPVDTMVAHSALSARTDLVSDLYVDQLAQFGGGLVPGRYMATLWPREPEETSRVLNSLQLLGAPTGEAEKQVAETFTRWDRRVLDLPAPYFRQVLNWLYRENRLALGTFVALGRKIDVRDLHCPLFLLAGGQDLIAPPAQVFAAAALIAAAEGDIETLQADCGHLALFMGRQTLNEEWPRIAQWLAK